MPFSLGLIGVALALLALSRQWPDRHWWSTYLQIVGSAVTFLGFSSAYVRAAYGRTLPDQVVFWAKGFGARLARLLARLRHRGINHVVHAALDVALVTDSAHFKLTSAFALDTGIRLGKQVEQLVEFVNRVAAQVSAVRDEIQRLDSRIDQTSADAAQATADTLAHLKGQIDELSARLDRAQVLDLRWAILGLFIMVVGIALSY
jgi:hypothetical protein